MTTVEIRDLLAATARACARGDKQLSYVNELLSFDWVPVNLYYYPGAVYPAHSYGVTQLPHSSAKSLWKRLMSAGFVKMRNPLPNKELQIKLSHPALS